MLNSLPGNLQLKKNFSDFSKNFLRKIIFSFIFPLIAFNANAQAPSVNISGPLKADRAGSKIAIVSKIATVSSRPNIVYRFNGNTSGASIASIGPFNYNSSTGEGSQTVMVNPGSSRGSFNLKVTVTDANGTSSSGKSVTVTGKSAPVRRTGTSTPKVAKN